MDTKRFTENKTGNLYSFFNLLTGKNDHYFVPHAMPPKWEFPAVDMWKLQQDANCALSRLDAAASRLEDPDLLFRPLQGREAITSSSMEGTIVTPEQLLLYELDPKEPGSAQDKAADWKEVFNYRRALAHGSELLEKIPFSTNLIQEMHGVLMDGVHGQSKRPGQFRRSHAQIGHNAKYNAPQVPELPELMSNLERFMNDQSESYDPLVMCYLVHYQFEAIHPFSDGNGRVGRALLALMVYKLLSHSKPWLYMSPFFEKYKEEYTGFLFKISTDGAWQEWIEFCLIGTIRQANDAVRRCDRFEELRKKYHEQVQANATPRSHHIIDGLFKNPIVTVTSTQEAFATTYHTAKSDLEKLQDSGILSELPDHRPRAFYARELMYVAYGDQGDEIEE